MKYVDTLNTVHRRSAVTMARLRAAAVREKAARLLAAVDAQAAAVENGSESDVWGVAGNFGHVNESLDDMLEFMNVDGFVLAKKG